MNFHISWIKLFGVLMIITTGCSAFAEPPSRDAIVLEPILNTTKVSVPTTIESDQICKIELGGYSIHDVIQVFDIPRIDLKKPIGNLSTTIGCVDDCPLRSVGVKGTLTTPQSQCERDRQTCGLWYSVDWKRYADSTAISGWVSAQDEDIRLVGDCANLSIIDPETVFSTSSG